MRKLLKNGIFKSFVSTILFGVIYTLAKLLSDGTFDFDKLLLTMGVFFVIMSFYNIITAKLREDKF